METTFDDCASPHLPHPLGMAIMAIIAFKKKSVVPLKVESVENSHSHKWCFGKVPQWSNNQQHVALAVNRDIC